MKHAVYRMIQMKCPQAHRQVSTAASPFRRRLFTYRLFVCLLPALFAVGCAPNIPPQSTIVDPTKLEAGTALPTAAGFHWPADRWWEVYGDPQLDRLVEQALQESPNLRLAEARVRMAQGAAVAAGAGLYPSLNAGGKMIDTHYSKNIYFAEEQAGHTLWDNAALLSASYILDLWGKEKAGYTAGLSASAAATAEAQVARLVLETGVVRTYIRLSAEYELLHVARKTLAQREQVYRLSRELLSAGIDSELAVSQAAIPIPVGRARIAELESAIVTTKQQIAALAGQGPGAGETIAQPALTLKDSAGLPASLPADLAGRRPDITAARLRVLAAGQDIVAAKAAFYPNINLAASGGYLGVGLDQFITPGSLTAQAGPAVNLPLFQGGRLRGNLSASTAAYDAAVEHYNQTVISALSAVAGRVEEIDSLKKQSKEAYKALKLARKAREISLRGYQAGLMEYINVLMTENTLLTEENRTVTLAARRLDAHARLMYELGGGYKAAPDPTTPPLPAPFAADAPPAPTLAATPADPGDATGRPHTTDPKEARP